MTRTTCLPIDSHESSIVGAVSLPGSTIILIAATGSGKSTRVPQFLHSAGIAAPGRMVGITQPRRVAAITLARRVAQELGSTSVGSTVGHSVRFDTKVSSSTSIKYVTDGMLLKEALRDPSLSSYSTILLDEFHLRSLHSDVLCAILKRIQKTRRPDLRLVVMSATLDIEEAKAIATYFNGADILRLPGRTYPIDIQYCTEFQNDYVESSVVTAAMIHVDHSNEQGDVLVFMTGQEDIEAAVAMLNKRARPFNLKSPSNSLTALPLYAALPYTQQMKAFESAPLGTRKVIFATNIAETSLTIPGVKYVIDSGLVKRKTWNPKTGIENLSAVAISQHEAWQRSGRAGREQPGTCFRLYTEMTFDKMRATLEPEILRTHLSSVLLQLKAMGINNLFELEFLDMPSKTSMIASLHELLSLKLLDARGHISSTGQEAARLPISPRLGKILLESVKLNCSRNILTLVAMLSVDNWFIYEDGIISSIPVKRFKSVKGDHFMLINTFNAAQSAEFDRTWCLNNGLHQKALIKASDIRKQISNLIHVGDVTQDEDPETLLKCIVSGLFLNAATLESNGTYLTTFQGHEVKIHPSSCLSNLKPNPPCVVYTELVQTTKAYIRGVSAINPTWVNDFIGGSSTK